MAEEFRQEKIKISPEDFSKRLSEIQGMSEESNDNPMDNIRRIQQTVAQESNKDFGDSPFSESGLKMTGTPPKDFQELLKKQTAPPSPFDVDMPTVKKMGRKQQEVSQKEINVAGTMEFDEIMARLKATVQTYEEIELPSKGRFYTNIPGVLHVKPMTGVEEQILATQRIVKKGKAIDQIFRNCIQENINVEDLLSIDRTYLLIYLRGISYTPEYDVEIKCPACGTKYSAVIDLNDMDVTPCPDEFSSESLCGVLPSSGLKFTYRLPTGQDEFEVSKYRENRIKMFGEQSEDDTLLYRAALLLMSIEKVTEKKELQMILKTLRIDDLSYLRNELNNPPFGVNTDVPQICPSCSEEFDVDLPLEASFFFPRKKDKTRA